VAKLPVNRFTLPIAAIIHHEDVRSQLVKYLNVEQPVTDIARIPMKYQNCPARAFTGNKPSVQPHSIFSDQ